MPVLKKTSFDQRLPLNPLVSLRDICATHPGKEASRSRFEGVPLLRVQRCSVIVVLRRRGASRGRPVKWFALVPRVHAGVSEGAKRLSGFLEGTREPTLGCFTQRIRNLPYRATGGYT